MFEGFTYTDYLLICVLWFQVANILVAVWPRLSRSRSHGEVSQKPSVKAKDRYEELFGGEKENA
jgi:hypothetical protein